MKLKLLGCALLAYLLYWSVGLLVATVREHLDYKLQGCAIMIVLCVALANWGYWPLYRACWVHYWARLRQLLHV